MKFCDSGFLSFQQPWQPARIRYWQIFLCRNLFQVKKEEPKQLSLNDKLVGSSIQVGLNDRIAFVNKLFSFSQSDFNKVLSRLNECSTKEEALKYFKYQVKPNYNWKGKEDLEDRFVILIERKFL